MICTIAPTCNTNKVLVGNSNFLEITFQMGEKNDISETAKLWVGSDPLMRQDKKAQ